MLTDCIHRWPGACSVTDPITALRSVQFSTSAVAVGLTVVVGKRVAVAETVDVSGPDAVLLDVVLLLRVAEGVLVRVAMAVIMRVGVGVLLVVQLAVLEGEAVGLVDAIAVCV